MKNIIPYKEMFEKGTKENLQKILQLISPYVIVTGSYAYGTQTSTSDIDFYIKELPEEQIDYENSNDDTYTKTLIKLFEELGYEWGSVFISSFHIDDTYIPLEFSAFYDIEEEHFPIEILGVKMIAAKSNHTSDKYLNGQKRSLIEKQRNNNMKDLQLNFKKDNENLIYKYFITLCNFIEESTGCLGCPLMPLCYSKNNLDGNEFWNYIHSKLNENLQIRCRRGDINEEINAQN